MKTVGVSDLKKHGKIHEDGETDCESVSQSMKPPLSLSLSLSLSLLPVHFGSFHLSASGRKLLYIAEREKPKTISFFKKTPGEVRTHNSILGFTFN